MVQVATIIKGGKFSELLYLFETRIRFIEWKQSRRNDSMIVLEYIALAVIMQIT